MNKRIGKNDLLLLGVLLCVCIAVLLVFSFDKEVVKIQNLTSQTTVSLYTVEGMLVASGMTDAKGCISLPMPKGTQTCMIVKTPSLTFKIRKP